MEPYPKSLHRIDYEEPFARRITRTTSALLIATITLFALEACAIIGSLLTAGTIPLMVFSSVVAVLGVLTGTALGGRAGAERFTEPRLTCALIVSSTIVMAASLLAAQLTTVGRYYLVENPESPLVPARVSMTLQWSLAVACVALVAAGFFGVQRALRMPGRR